ncbi:MAG: tRNA uridine-5-carboxymethylaminomethyl(34) synthesis enzyme MnmG, partial [Dehalococcoidia bacterium]
EIGRLKTGTCPRRDGRSIDYSGLDEQPGDSEPCLFSFDGPRQLLPQVSCWITHTTPLTRRIITKNIDKSAIYNGTIDSRGPRYCPSIEDKVVKFPDRAEHRIFLEPEGLDTVEVYPNGLSTSLPYSVQQQFVASIPGLENAVIVRPGYAIEYDYVIPTQLRASLAVGAVDGLFLAGQINGSTGYEEAAAQGLVAGINAVRWLRGQEEFVLGRDQAYIGVLIDDLVTRGVDGEPYRMFTSRAEYRLLLREDNADLRLAGPANLLGLITPERRAAVETKNRLMADGLEHLLATRVTPRRDVNECLERYGESALASPATAFELLKRPGLDYAEVAEVAELQRYPAAVEEQLEIAASYHGYVERQGEEIARMRSLESTRLPRGLDYASVSGLSHEAREKLSRVRPTSLGQVSRISGLTPAALSALAIHLRKLGRP